MSAAIVVRPAKTNDVWCAQHHNPPPIQTTLYDLITALHEAAEPDLVVATVVHLLRAGRIKCPVTGKTYDVHCG